MLDLVDNQLCLFPLTSYLTMVKSFREPTKLWRSLMVDIEKNMQENPHAVFLFEKIEEITTHTHNKDEIG